jgi:Xaa-Pro aminopeptidase
MTHAPSLEARLEALRAAMSAAGIEAFLVPRADAHQNEYVTPADERLKFISGFSGTGGTAVITMTEAAIFTDGRYLIQAANEAPASSWTVQNVKDSKIHSWLATRIARGARVGFDAALHTPREIETISQPLARQEIDLVATGNLVDAIWHERPPEPAGVVEIYPAALSGEETVGKLSRVGAALRKEECSGLVVTALDSLAWAFNIRGSDLAMTPVVFGHALIHADGSAIFFVNPIKISAVARIALQAAGVELATPDALAGHLASQAGKLMRLDEATASVKLVETARAAGVEVDIGKDPILTIKAAKNATEIAGMRAAHLRDGAAIVRFLKWFATDRPARATEWDAVEALAGFRAPLAHYRGPSFNTISAAAENAAQAHYRVDPERARPIGENEIYLVDSGGQFLDGTTDVTRVTVTGTPSVEMRLRYTQVLKGHVALCRQRFPQGVNGAQIDGLARQFLWSAGVDFDHGTGHGVGHYLSVHEGPQSISHRGAGVPLVPGMVISIEPGYYKRGAFGIRIENLGAVRPVADPHPLAERTVLEFEMLTLAPYEPKLIEPSLLTPDEIAWIDAYHAEVRERLAPQLSGEDLSFLIAMTAPLG